MAKQLSLKSILVLVLVALLLLRWQVSRSFLYLIYFEALVSVVLLFVCGMRAMQRNTERMRAVNEEFFLSTEQSGSSPVASTA